MSVFGTSQRTQSGDCRWIQSTDVTYIKSTWFKVTQPKIKNRICVQRTEQSQWNVVIFAWLAIGRRHWSSTHICRLWKPSRRLQRYNGPQSEIMTFNLLEGFRWPSVRARTSCFDYKMSCIWADQHQIFNRSPSVRINMKVSEHSHSI